MPENLLILGGTTEASALAKAVADAELSATLSYAGRVAEPMAQPLPTRVGGFGGIAGLRRYCEQNQITQIIDATHPFAAEMSHNAAAVAREMNLRLAAFTRAPWRQKHGDRWCKVASIEDAAASLKGPAKRIFLAVGRQHLAAFRANPQHHYLLRLVDPPCCPLPSADAKVIVARGPFDQAADMALLQEHQIEIVVSKNAGGTGAYAKIAAARALGIPVLMIDRPVMPERREFTALPDVMAWLSHAKADLGV